MLQDLIQKPGQPSSEAFRSVSKCMWQRKTWEISLPQDKYSIDSLEKK